MPVRTEGRGRTIDLFASALLLTRIETCSTRGFFPLPGQGVAAKIKGIGASPGLDSSQVAHVLGDGRGCHADLVVAQMETKGIGRIDFYEVGDVGDCFAASRQR